MTNSADPDQTLQLLAETGMNSNDSHEMSSLIFSKKNNNILACHLYHSDWCFKGLMSEIL